MEPQIAERVGSRIDGEAEKETSGVCDSDLAEGDSGRRQWQEFGNLSQAGPRYRPGKQLEDRVDNYQVAQLVSMAEELPSAVVIATWSKDEQRDWRTG